MLRTATSGYQRTGPGGCISPEFVQRWAFTRTLGPVTTFIVPLIGNTALGLRAKFRLSLPMTGSQLVERRKLNRHETLPARSHAFSQLLSRSPRAFRLKAEATENRRRDGRHAAGGFARRIRSVLLVLGAECRAS